MCCSAQKAKSKWGTQALEERFRHKFPHLRILRIDSESVADPSHAAFGCIAHLNEILTQYDLVIASPSLETGVSIDIRGHFDGVWGIFQGVQPVNSVRHNSVQLSGAELKKLQDKRAKTKTERHQQRKGELSRRYEIDVTPELVERDDDGWYPQLRMHYYLTLGREFLTNRDAKRAKAQLEAGENSIWKPDFNKGQLLPAVLLLESLNLLQFLTPCEVWVI